MRKNGILPAHSAVQELWQRYKVGPDAGNEADRNRLVELNLELVRFIAARIALRLPHSVDPEDLVSAGVFGLLDAVEGFDLSRRLKFQTFASPRIRGSILDYLRSIDIVPRLVRERSRTLERALSSLASRLCRDPTPEEIQAELGMTEAECEKVIKDGYAKSTLSIDAERRRNGSDGEASTLARQIADSSIAEPLAIVLTEDLRAFIVKGLGRRRALIVVLHHFEGYSMLEIANMLYVSESRISQEHSIAIGIIRSNPGLAKLFRTEMRSRGS